MFSNFAIALLFALGFGGWVYSKIYKKSGGNNSSSLTVAGLSAFAALVIGLVLLNMFIKK